jgi:hypothetical protein
MPQAEDFRKHETPWAIWVLMKAPYPGTIDPILPPYPDSVPAGSDRAGTEAGAVPWQSARLQAP